jgi:hypothetical protein
MNDILETVLPLWAQLEERRVKGISLQSQGCNKKRAFSWQNLIRINNITAIVGTLVRLYQEYSFFFFFFFWLWDYMHCGHSWPIVPASGDNEDDCGEHDGM